MTQFINNLKGGLDRVFGFAIIKAVNHPCDVFLTSQGLFYEKKGSYNY